MTEEKISRRGLLKGALAGLAALPAASLVAPDARAAQALSETDEAAKSVGYVTDAKRVDPKTNPTYKAGQTCANCFQYTAAAGSAEGPCRIFPNKTVKAAGWCKVWVPQQN
ncbi:MAG TPA: high-potential iron-sulfur protein [Steroidobacteraceae bacterium]|nr:high-potential iron-sulfur protein [Steroidobacteraceae bacterium]